MVPIMNTDELTVIKKRNFLFAQIDRPYLIVAVLLIVFVSGAVITGRQGPYHVLYDYWEHTAAIKEMSRDLLNPQNPLLQIDGSTTPRYTPYVFIAAFFKKFIFNDLTTLLSVISIVNFIVLVIGIYRFCADYFHDSRMPLYCLVSLLFLWGGDFNYSCEYNLRFLTYTLFYPSMIAFSFSFLGLYYFLSFVRFGSTRAYVKYCIVALFVVVSHPLTGSFFLLAIFLLAITEGPRPWRNLFYLGINVVIVFACLLAWPYFHFLSALGNSVANPWCAENRVYLYRFSNVYKMGPAVLGVPVVFVFMIKRKFSFISLGFLICASIYVFTYKPNIYMGERYIFYTLFFMHMALAWYLRQMNVLSPAVIKKTLLQLSERNLHVLLFAVIVGGAVTGQLTKIVCEQSGYTVRFTPRPVIRPYVNPLDKFHVLKDRFKQGSVVLSDPLTAWVLPTLSDAKIVALYHDNPLVPDNLQRTMDSMAIYAAKTSLSERRKILERYQVTHVLLNYARMIENDVNQINNYCLNFKIPDEAIRDLNLLGRVVFKNETFTLYRINRKE